MSTRTVKVGDLIPARTLQTISGAPVAIPAAGGLIHLQLRRFAGCPVCNLHLRSIVARHDEIAARGIREVVVFHSTDQALRKYEGDLPFPLVADPDRALYREFGVEKSLLAVLHPRMWLTIPRAMAKSIWATLRRRAPVAPLAPRGGNLGLPADLLISSDSRVVAVKYGRHAYDQWSVDELLSHASSASTAA